MSLPAILRLLRGLNVPPIYVAHARAALELGALAFLAAFFEYVVGISPAWALPGLFFLRGTGEGIVDQIDPAKKRSPENV